MRSHRLRLHWCSTKLGCVSAQRARVSAANLRWIFNWYSTELGCESARGARVSATNLRWIFNWYSTELGCESALQAGYNVCCVVGDAIQNTR